MYERRRQPMVSRSVFAVRVLRHAAVASAIVGASLGIGAVGYHTLEGLPWVDALLYAAMILTGMGPTAELKTTAGKLFTVGYALFSAVVFLTIVAVLFAPVFHRFLHHFHLELQEGKGR